MPARPQPTGAHLRRSARIQHRTALLISGSDRGVPFTADGESVTVNQYGACVRTTYRLKLGMRLRLNLKQSRQMCRARVVCLSITSASEYGIELESPAGSFWGIEIPTAEHKPPSSSNGREDTARAMSVVVTGISAICMPFREETTMLPLGSNTAVLRVRPLVNLGQRLRLLVGPAATPMKATVTAVRRDRKNEGWKLAIEILG